MARRRLTRPAAAVAALALLAVSLAPASGQAPPGSERLCEGGSNALLKHGRWTTLEAPEELGKITAHAVGGQSGRLVLISDGRKVLRSTDRGCTWNTVYEVETPSVEETPADGLLPEVGRLLIPRTSSRALMVLEGVGRAAASQVLFSEEGGARDSWKPSRGLPSVSGFREIMASPDQPDVIYLTTAVVDAAGEADPAGASGPLYVSRDGGASFEQAEPSGGQVERLAPEADTGGAHLWVVRSSGVVQRSEDFGATFETIAIPPVGEEPDPVQGEPPRLPDHWRDIAVHRFAHTEHVVVALASPTRAADVTRAVVSFTKGKTWEELPFDGLGPAGGLFFGNDGDQLFSAVPTDNTAYRGPGLLQFEPEEGRWRGVDDFGLTSLKDPRRVSEPVAADPFYNAIWMRRDRPDPDHPDLLARFEPPARDGGTPIPKLPKDCGETRPKSLPAKQVTFDPGRLDVTLEPGRPASVPLKADLLPDPTPSDVFFLLDHSDSMDPAMEGLFCSLERLVRDLPERNLDVHFGLGGYNGLDGYTYRRLVNILPPEQAGPALSEALKKLFSTAGVQEPMRSALFQTATGAGYPSREVEPGQQADWRDAVKKIPRIVLVIADEPYEERTPGEPSFDEVVGALRAKDIKVMGLRVQPFAKEQATSPDHSPVRQLLLLQQLTNFARETGGVAPKGGVDCDGGGTPDIQTGDPVVCTIDERGIRQELDDTLVSVFQSLAGQDRRTVRLVPRRTSGLPARVDGGELEVDLRRPSRLEGTAVLSCSAEQAGKRFDLTFDVVTGERVLGSLDGVAQCGGLPAVIPPVKPPRGKASRPEPAQPAPTKAPAPAEPPAAVPAPQAPAPQPGVAAAPPPPPPAPAPVSSAPAQAPAPGSAQAPQVGAAAQEDRQVAAKLATVTTEPIDERLRSEHAMVRARPGASGRRSPLPAEAAITLGVGISGLFGYVAFAANPRRRRRQDVEPALALEHVPRR